jgi:hypothetical protein
MTATPRVVLGGDTLNRKWWTDVNNGTHAAPSWLPVGGVVNFQPALAPNSQDDSDFDSGGYGSTAITKLDWSLAMTLARKATAADASVYDPGQELLRAAANNLSPANRVEVRWYEMNVNSAGVVVGPKTEAWQGYGSVTWAPAGGGMEALDQVAMTIAGQGIRTAITHPEGAQVVPITSSCTPYTGTTLATAGGTLCKIMGTNFFLLGVSDVIATSGVKFDTTNATSWIVESDSVIWAVAPAHAGGSVSVKVTNSAGASTVMCAITYA